VSTGLQARLEFPLPRSLRAGRAEAIFCYGTCFHPTAAIESLELIAGGERHLVEVWGMPRPDWFAALHPGFDPLGLATAAVDPGSPDPELRSFRSGFWSTITVGPQSCGALELRLEARLKGGSTETTELGTVAVAEPDPAPPPAELVAIAMTTYNPEIELFQRQVESLRAQTHRDWVCIVSDDHSDPEAFATIERTLGDDRRFRLSRSPERVGFYRNFERALSIAPPEARYVALCDQDDRWYPGKLEALLDGIGDAELVYSDQRLVGPDGAVIAESLWSGGRRNNHTNLISMLIANSVTGAAAMFTRETAAAALPFPEFPGWQFHDHWLALVALARGRIAYLDRPLYDYVQHPAAILGQVSTSSDEGQPAPVALHRRAKSFLREQLSGWWPMYFCGYLRLAVQARALLTRCGADLDPGDRRGLERFVAADRSAAALAALRLRSARGLLGRNETMGAESQLVRGLIWRRLTAARARRVEAPVAWHLHADLPVCGPDVFEQKRLRRWRARGRR
jgi:glycosyltransferase involved in cell wall biosynthesis